jgi:hypothetical protein
LNIEGQQIPELKHFSHILEIEKRPINMAGFVLIVFFTFLQKLQLKGLGLTFSESHRDYVTGFQGNSFLGKVDGSGNKPYPLALLQPLSLHPGHTSGS